MFAHPQQKPMWMEEENGFERKSEHDALSRRMRIEMGIIEDFFLM